MEVKGKVFLVGQVETAGTSGFTKRLIVVETEEQYSQKIPVEFVKDKTSMLDGVVPGMPVTVHINLRGSEYNGKHYLQAQGWKIDKPQQQQGYGTY